MPHFCHIMTNNILPEILFSIITRHTFLFLLDRARDLFMFSFYARGMPFVDIVFLKHDSILTISVGKLMVYTAAAGIDPSQVLNEKAALEKCKSDIHKIKGTTVCINCGAEVPADASFCASCGAKIEKADPEVVHDMEEGAKEPQTDEEMAEEAANEAAAENSEEAGAEAAEDASEAEKTAE